jgi:hypothetical protein
VISSISSGKRARHARWSQAADNADHEENAGREQQQIRERQQKMAGPLAEDDLRAIDRLGRKRLHRPGGRGRRSC